MQQLCEAGEEEFLEIMALVGVFCSDILIFIYSYINIFLYSYILGILEIMAQVGYFVLIYSSLIFLMSWYFWAFCLFIHS